MPSHKRHGPHRGSGGHQPPPQPDVAESAEHALNEQEARPQHHRTQEMSIQHLTQVARIWRSPVRPACASRVDLPDPQGANRAGSFIFSEGVLEVLPDGFGFLRAPTSLPAGPDDIYVSPPRYANSTYRPATRSRQIRPPKEGGAISRSSKSKPSISRRQIKRDKRSSKPPPLYPRAHQARNRGREPVDRVMDP
jgi:transcription termination factor Rho